jgi:peroxiredoxin
MISFHPPLSFRRQHAGLASRFDANPIVGVIVLAALLAGYSQVVATEIDQTRTASVGRKVEELDLLDERGKVHTWQDFEDRDFIVLAFLGTECPLAKLYGPRLDRLAKRYAERSVTFVGVNSNAHDSLADIARYAHELKLTLPVLKDTDHQLADAVGAERTPQVFVLDRNRVVRYAGRIDDQYGVGYIRPEPAEHDLERALDELLAGADVTRPVTNAPGCVIARARTAQDDSPVTYSNQIARILQERCVECHRAGEVAPFALTEYEEVAGWAETILEVVQEGRMPPWHATSDHVQFANDRRLSAKEKEQLAAWVNAGAPQGDPATLPAPREFPTGWQLPTAPDLVVNMANEPYEVPAEGAVAYQYFGAETELTEDRWIKAVEVVPGNRAVVHHILVFVQPPEDSKEEFDGGVRGFLAGYVPGLRAEPFPEGMAKFLPAGSRLLFQMHYTPIGSPQKDLSRIGFVFADPQSVTHEVQTISAFQPNLRIPKQTAAHQESTKTRLTQPVQLLSFMPHMHLRGSAFRYLTMAPGAEEWTELVNVPRYDFNWQTNYRLSEPWNLPANSYIKCEAVFDNSTENPSNPNSEETVRWGEQTWDEMLIGYFDVALPVPTDQLKQGQPRPLPDPAEEFILHRDANDDFQLQVNELPLRVRVMAWKADQDRDGVISREELIAFFRRERGDK